MAHQTHKIMDSQAAVGLGQSALLTLATKGKCFITGRNTAVFTIQIISVCPITNVEHCLAEEIFTGDDAIPYEWDGGWRNINARVTSYTSGDASVALEAYE